MQFLELRLPPLALVVLFAVAMTVVAHLTPAWTIAFPAHTALATALAAAGLFAALAGVIAFRQYRTTVDPRSPERSSAMVTTGIYRYSRNPMYLGFLFVLAGWAAYLANAGAVALLPAFVAHMSRFQIRPEERYLLDKFGTEFARYMATVRRWV